MPLGAVSVEGAVVPKALRAVKNVIAGLTRNLETWIPAFAGMTTEMSFRLNERINTISFII